MWTQIQPFSQAENAYRRQQIMAGFASRRTQRRGLQALATGWRVRHHREHPLALGHRPVPHVSRAA